MGHKVDLAEVIAFSDKVAKAADELTVDIGVVRTDIANIDSMDTFTGYAAKSAKGYLNELHVTLLESFEVLYATLKENTKEHIATFQSSVDTSDKAIVQSKYIIDIRIKVEIDHTNIENNEDSVIKTLDDIADIIYVRKPSLENARNDYKEAMETIEELEENLDTFTTKGKKDDNLTKDLLDNIKLVMNKANAHQGEARFKEAKHGAEGESIAALRKIVSHAGKGANLVEGHVKDEIKKREEQKQKNQRNKPKPPEVKKEKQSFWSKAKNVGKKALSKTKDTVIGKNTIPHRTLGIMGTGLMYNSNYQGAKDQGKTGVDAHVHAVEDTAVDVAVGTVVAAGSVAAVAGLTALAGVTLPAVAAAAAVITVGIVVNKVLDIKIGKSGKSINDRIKGGYRKIKGWFK